MSTECKSIPDKMFFIDKVFDPFSSIVDFGCANGELIKALQALFDEYRYVGYKKTISCLRMYLLRNCKKKQELMAPYPIT